MTICDLFCKYCLKLFINSKNKLIIKIKFNNLSKLARLIYFDRFGISIAN